MAECSTFWGKADITLTSRNLRFLTEGRSGSKAVERDFPHIVEIVVPPGGLGKRLDLMYDWHRSRGTEAHRGGRRREEDRDIIRWCFADRALADAFAAAFGGVT